MKKCILRFRLIELKEDLKHAFPLLWMTLTRLLNEWEPVSP